MLNSAGRHLEHCFCVQALGYRLILAFKWRIVLIALRGACLILIAFPRIFSKWESLFSFFPFSKNRVQETIYFEIYIYLHSKCVLAKWVRCWQLDVFFNSCCLKPNKPSCFACQLASSVLVCLWDVSSCTWEPFPPVIFNLHCLLLVQRCSSYDGRSAWANSSLQKDDSIIRTGFIL